MINRMFLRMAALVLALTFAGSAFAASQTQTPSIDKKSTVSHAPYPPPDPWEVSHSPWPPPDPWER